MVIKKRDEYENGDITFMVYDIGGGDIHYWLRAGAALLSLDSTQLNDLYEVLHAYVHEGQFVQDLMAVRGGERHDG